MDNPDILSQIVTYTGSFAVANTLQKHIYDFVFNIFIPKKTLLYGHIQAGKTSYIINYIKLFFSPKGIHTRKQLLVIVILPNSILSVKQFSKRLGTIKHEILTKDTSTIKSTIKTNLLLVMNNIYKKTKLKELILDREYTLIVDECDLCLRKADPYIFKNKNISNQLHITATPFNLKEEYTKTIKLNPPPNYYGLSKFVYKIDKDYMSLINDFMTTERGMLLINRSYKIVEMSLMATHVSYNFPDIPIVLLSTKKTLYLNKKTINLASKNVSKIIDQLKNYSHIIFIANRLASRCISYVSSDYTRHLTHQATNTKSSATNFMQGLRLCGIYNDNPTLTLYLESENDVQTIQKYTKYIKKQLDKLNLL